MNTETLVKDSSMLRMREGVDFVGIWNGYVNTGDDKALAVKAVNDPVFYDSMLYFSVFSISQEAFYDALMNPHQKRSVGLSKALATAVFAQGRSGGELGVDGSEDYVVVIDSGEFNPIESINKTKLVRGHYVVDLARVRYAAGILGDMREFSYDSELPLSVEKLSIAKATLHIVLGDFNLAKSLLLAHPESDMAKILLKIVNIQDK